MTGFLLFGSFIVLLILGVPIAVSLAMATMSAIIFSPDITLTLSVVTQRIFGGLDSTSIMAIAFFVLAGNIMTKGGISRRLVEFANCIVGGFRGGMSLAMVLACAFFAALSGSAPATVVAIGVMLYPDMVRLGYSKERTAGLLVVAGGLGPIIPPSIIMVVYCTITGASVGKMFSAGMGIGLRIVTTGILCETICGEFWQGYESTLSTHIRHLREKIEENPSKPVSLVTAKGLGYRLNLKEVSP